VVDAPVVSPDYGRAKRDGDELGVVEEITFANRHILWLRGPAGRIIVGGWLCCSVMMVAGAAQRGQR